MTMGDTRLLLKKAYLSPNGKSLSSIGGRDGFSNSGSSKVLSNSSSSLVNSLVSLSSAGSGESNTKTATTSSIGSMTGESSTKHFFD